MCFSDGGRRAQNETEIEISSCSILPRSRECGSARYQWISKRDRHTTLLDMAFLGDMRAPYKQPNLGQTSIQIGRSINATEGPRVSRRGRKDHSGSGRLALVEHPKHLLAGKKLKETQQVPDPASCQNHVSHRRRAIIWIYADSPRE